MDHNCRHIRQTVIPRAILHSAVRTYPFGLHTYERDSSIAVLSELGNAGLFWSTWHGRLLESAGTVNCYAHADSSHKKAAAQFPVTRTTAHRADSSSFSSVLSKSAGRLVGMPPSWGVVGLCQAAVGIRIWFDVAVLIPLNGNRVLTFLRFPSTGCIHRSVIHQDIKMLKKYADFKILKFL